MVWDSKLYIDTVLPFGLRSAPKIFNAIADAMASSLIPEDTVELGNFLKYHFVADAMISDYETVSDDYNTAYIDTTGTALEVSIQSEPKQLAVTDGSGAEVSIDHNTANVFVRDGIAHRIKTVLLSK